MREAAYRHRISDAIQPRVISTGAAIYDARASAANNAAIEGEFISTESEKQRAGFSIQRRFLSIASAHRQFVGVPLYCLARPELSAEAASLQFCALVGDRQTYRPERTSPDQGRAAGRVHYQEMRRVA